MSQGESRARRTRSERTKSSIERRRGRAKRAAWMAAAGIAWLPALATAATQSPAQISQQQAAAPAPAPIDPAVQQRLDELEKSIQAIRNDITDVRTEQQKPPAPGVKVTTKGGLQVQTDDGQFSFRAIGRLQVDGAFYNQDKSKLGDGVQLRRARLGAQGTLFYDWLYKVEFDFGRDTAAGTVGTKDAYISYVGWNPVQFTIGNHYEPFCLECVTSEAFTTFIERALPITQPTSSFDPDRHIGISASHYDSNWSASVGAFMKNLDDTVPTNEGDQQFDVAGRLTYDPILEKTRVLHVGVSGRYSNPSDSTVALSLKPESNVTAVKFLNTGIIANVDHFIEVAPELAVVWGPASIQGEYFWDSIKRTHPSGTATSPSVDLTGWYAYASYFLTGESRNYNPTIARFDRVSPFKNLNQDGGWGAFELAARVSNANYDDGPFFQHGEETNYTLGLNWYANPYIKFMANYIWVLNNNSATGLAGDSSQPKLLPGHANDRNDNPQIFELRAQVDW